MIRILTLPGVSSKSKPALHGGFLADLAQVSSQTFSQQREVFPGSFWQRLSCVSLEADTNSLMDDRLPVFLEAKHPNESK